MHTAPGHGQEDYEAFRAALGEAADSTEIRCPVDDAGHLTSDLAAWTSHKSIADRLIGKDVLGDAVPEMVKILEDQGSLLKAVKIKHRYPTDWKTKKPVIVRYVRYYLVSRPHSCTDPPLQINAAMVRRC